jgi:hypothetical protein
MNLREIDHLIATKVMGWEPEEIEGSAYLSGYVLYKREEPPHIPDYQFKPSTNIADAWQVVEKLIDEGYDINVYNHNKEFNVEINIEEDDKHLWFYGEADSAPLAICLAALKAVGVEVEVTEQ